MRIVKVILTFFVLLISCQSPKDKAKDEEKFSWNAGISAPKYYPAAPSVEFSYQGKGVAGASTGAGDGWGTTSGGFTGGDVFKPVPDSVFVSWKCGVDHFLYKGGFKLPRKKILALFNKGTKDPYTGRHEEYSTIVAGTAPGGNVTIWMKSGSKITEIAKFKAENKGIYNEGSKEQQKIMDEIYKSREFINSETNVFRYFHGVPYKIWETGEKEYNYDIGFSSEDDLIKPEITTFYAKDGSWYQAGGTSNFENIDWNIFKYKENNNLVKKQKLPIQILAEWENDSVYYSTNIILPQEFEKTFVKSYALNDTKQYFDRIVIGVKRGGSYGMIWIEGKGKRKSIMNFKVFKAKMNEMGTYIGGGYSLPKGFIFPKWEKGKEPLSKPDVDYWQEQ